jgi:hypothetical protein
VRQILAVLILCSSMVLAGAAKPTPTPKPSATPVSVPTATPVPPKALPLVVVFPFDASTDIKPGTGQNAAQLFTQQMNADGGLDTIQGPATVKRADYLKYANSINADYYLSGYMTPLGNGVSLVEQVVSTRSGTIVYGQTAQIESFQDATAQATMIHDGIMAREKQMSDAYQSAQAEATSTPTPSNQANLKGLAGLASIFKHKGKATPVPAAMKPSKGILVVHVGGALPASDTAKATSELYSALGAHYNVRLMNAAPQNLSKEADGICGTDRNNTIATGTASAKVTRHGLGRRADYTFVLAIYTCFGAKLDERTATAGSLANAVRSAVDAFVSAHPQNA